jgi:tetratricopeptide (TPR) repeat protein
MEQPLPTRTVVAQNETYSIAHERVLNVKPPKACKPFLGREAKLKELHELLKSENKIFIHGIPGIGKSEFAKSYAAEHKDEYTNIIYFTYNGSLKSTIAKLNFIGEGGYETEDNLFFRHNRFLQSLKEDSLIIVDNFNTTAYDDKILSELLDYDCKIIFTTRSIFKDYCTFELSEIADIETLILLFNTFYEVNADNRDVIVKIIETVHRHTFAVELSARFLNTTINCTPKDVLRELTKNHISLDADDNIIMKKDRRTYNNKYNWHINTLFSFCTLTDIEQHIMRGAAFLPTDGIHGKDFAFLLNLQTMNDITILIDSGYIHRSDDIVSLQPMIREVVFSNLQPSITNCGSIIDTFQKICLHRGVEIPCYIDFLKILENTATHIIKDDGLVFLRFLKDVYPYMEKHKYSSGMKLVIAELDSLLKSVNFTDDDFALLCDFKAGYEYFVNGDFEKAFALQSKALSQLSGKDELLMANLQANLGYLYHNNGQLDSAAKYMQSALDIFRRNKIVNNDLILLAHNFANLLDDKGELVTACANLKNIAQYIRKSSTHMCLDYADICFSMGIIQSKISCGGDSDNTDSADNYFAEAFSVYRVILKDNPVEFEDKVNRFEEISMLYDKSFNGISVEII